MAGRHCYDHDSDSIFPLQEHLSGSGLSGDGWQTLLRLAGFGFGDEKIVRFPTEKSDTFAAVWALLQVG